MTPEFDATTCGHLRCHRERGACHVLDETGRTLKETAAAGDLSHTSRDGRAARLRCRDRVKVHFPGGRPFLQPAAVLRKKSERMFLSMLVSLGSLKSWRPVHATNER